ncbi:MAG: oxidoreductase [Blastocatellia bacterium AA13]|nr:MAG: oxidoreductase [Blastocatellia bacterium AA13]
MNLLENKVVIITGASSGIGEATAKKLAAEGAHVMLGARRKDRLEALAAAIGTNAAFQQTDVTSRAEMERLASVTLDRFGRIDAIVNNAGIMPLSFLSADRVDDWDRMIDVNIKGVLYGIHAVLKHMLERGTGHIVNVSSVAGHVVRPTSAVYAGTKHAVRAISEGLRKETVGKIRVTIISPGAVVTELRDSITDETVKEALSNLTYGIPASAIADAISYALGLPDQIAINEIVVRPTAQEL